MRKSVFLSAVFLEGVELKGVHLPWPPFSYVEKVKYFRKNEEKALLQ